MFKALWSNGKTLNFREETAFAQAFAEAGH